MREIFQEIDFFTPTIEFLKSYPNMGTDTLISVTPLMFAPFERDRGDSLGVAGSSQIRDFRDVTSGSILSQRINFQLFIRRNFGDPSFYLPVGMFIQNLPLWINMENAHRGTQYENPLLPRFSNFPDGKDSITSDGGTIWRQVPEITDIFELMIQIHVDYDIKINRKEEW